MNLINILLLVLYIVFTHVIAQHIGEKRKIGYGKSVLWSVLFTPVIGLVITLLSAPIDKK